MGQIGRGPHRGEWVYADPTRNPDDATGRILGYILELPHRQLFTLDGTYLMDDGAYDDIRPPDKGGFIDLITTALDIEWSTDEAVVQRAVSERRHREVALTDPAQESLSAEGWREGDVDEIDDAEFSLESAQLTAGRFVIHRRLDWRQSLALMDPDVPHGWRWTREVRHRYRGQIRDVRTPVCLTIDGATEFGVDDEAGTGVLILESIERRPEGITIVGVIPCQIHIRAPAPRLRILIGAPHLPADDE
ncbi:hypothetical protein [Microbacterium sp. cf046]|uniref:hypothetical protein n=1 Tax=Microbacterium sp. cf046 TaxID=1761803 RepID=UPI0011139E9C|nr:hypothetical protein [Microbacterium sp. cf046]